MKPTEFEPNLVQTLKQSLTHNSHPHADVQKSSNYIYIYIYTLIIITNFFDFVDHGH